MTAAQEPEQDLFHDTHIQCRRCKGEGKITALDRDTRLVSKQPCPDCKGLGYTFFHQPDTRGEA